MTTRQVSSWMIALALAGFAISLYSFLHHQGFAPGTFCTINATINCDVVNRGPYSTIAGIPVSLVGLFGYGFIAIASFLFWRNPDDRSLKGFLLLVSIFGMLFAGYLSGIEAFVLHAWCLLCVASQLLILFLLILAIRLYRL